MSSVPERSIAIDEEGFLISGESRWTDERAGREVFENLRVTETKALVSETDDTPVLVEAFDEPLIAQQVERHGSAWLLIFPYGFSDTFDPKSLVVDEWDRFHGVTSKGVPFVFKRSAQAAFFDLVDEFDDDSVTIDDEKIPVAPFFQTTEDVSKAKYWTDVYVTEGKPRWDLAGPAEALKDMLPRLKMSKARVLVLGCGEGHDAAFFAQEGHFVTGVDISPEAIRRAKEKYGDFPFLSFMEGDAFTIDLHEQSFDVVFEHTMYCAIDPARRNDLVRRWWRLLAPGGHLMAVFFAVNWRGGPPFGASEWELRERLRKNFRFLFWGRWKKSIEKRQGKELFVYAQKLELR